MENSNKIAKWLAEKMKKSQTEVTRFVMIEKAYYSKHKDVSYMLNPNNWVDVTPL